jgi:hypothetical protein
VLDALAQERQFHGGGPDEGWPRWSKAQAGEKSNRVLVVASKGWFRCYEGKEVSGVGLGAAAEASVIEQRLYNAAGVSPDVRIISFGPLDRSALPLDLQRYHTFTLPDEEPELVRWLTRKASAAPTPSALTTWPTEPPALGWSLCDHVLVRDSFAQLLSAACGHKVLLLRGPSGRGKTCVTEQLLGGALRLPWLSCGRLDLKGGTRLEEEFGRFASQLGVAAPTGTRFTEGLTQILTAVLARQKPTLFIIDTYEAAGEEIRDWIAKSLLTSLIPATASHLRVVIAGQATPAKQHASWAVEAAGPIDLSEPTIDDWFAFAQRVRPDVTRAFVEQLFQMCGGRCSILAQVLGPPP